MTTMTARRRAHAPDPPPIDDTAWDASRLRAVWDRVRPNPTRVAADLSVTTETLRRWKKGRYVPDAIEVRLLARALGVTVDEILPPE